MLEVAALDVRSRSANGRIVIVIDDASTDNSGGRAVTDVLRFGQGIADQDVWLSRSGNHLQIDLLGDGGRVTVNNWYAGTQYRIEELHLSDGQKLLHAQVDSLVQAMAAFAPPAPGQTTLTPEQQSALAPVIAAASLKVFDLIENGDALRERLYANAALFRTEMSKLGFTLAGEGHPIIPVMLGDAALAQKMAARMLKKGVYVIGFSFPVVPKGQARIRTQMSAAHSENDVRRAIAAFEEVGRELGVI